MNKIEYSHKCSGDINKRSLTEAPYHRDVNWLTTSLVILREIVITIAICYPSGNWPVNRLQERSMDSIFDNYPRLGGMLLFRKLLDR